MDIDKKINFSFLEKIPLEKVIAYDVNFFDLYQLIKSKFKTSYLFESLHLPRHQDRFHTIGFSPALIFSAKGNTLEVLGTKEMMEITLGVNEEVYTFENINPYFFLKDEVELNYFSKKHQGGLIGYFSYESVNYFQNFIQLNEHKDFANFRLGFYYDGLIYDSTTSTLSYYTYADDRSNVVVSLLEELKANPLQKNILTKVQFLGNNATKEEFIESVKNTKDKINNGYSFQAEVGFKSYYEIEGDKIEVYKKLRQINPGPYMYYLKFDDEELLGSSPEILVSSHQGMVLTEPTAGSIRRGQDADEDRLLARQLLNDSKEIAEHNMLVDLYRNDLARVCRPNTVKIKDLMFLIKFSHIQHIVSSIVGHLRADKDIFDLLASILPGGVVSGAPKLETIKIIDTNEDCPRGPYGGAVGRLSLNGDGDFCLPLRSLFCKGDRCFAQTCAGVVYDSDPQKEYQEVLHKVEAMMKTIKSLEVG